jgi:hypothetical protein
MVPKKGVFGARAGVVEAGRPLYTPSALAGFVRGRTDGMIVTSLGLGPLSAILIIALAARHPLPAIYHSAASSPMVG